MLKRIVTNQAIYDTSSHSAKKLDNNKTNNPASRESLAALNKYFKRYYYEVTHHANELYRQIHQD